MKARTFDQVSVERMQAEPTPETDACLAAARGQSLEGLCRKLERSAAQYKSDLWAERTEHRMAKTSLTALAAERNKLRKALEKISMLSQTTCLSFEAQSFKATSIACFALAEIEKEGK